MRIGIFGGTFDPPHVGHLIVAADAAAVLGLDRVGFVPTGTHPLKRTLVGAPAELRLQMIVAATAGSDLFAVDDREIQRPGPSYTIDTVLELESENPDAELFLLVGSDILGEIHRWHRSSELTEHARVAVLSRADAPAHEVSGIDLDVVRVNVTHVAISSTDIRHRIRASRPYRYMVPDPVYEIIEAHGLYAKA